MTLTLQFVLMIDTDLSAQEVLTKITSDLYHDEKWKDNSYIANKNLIEVFNNEDSNFMLSLDENEGFLYYPIRLESTPLDIKITEEEQIKLASCMVEILRYSKCRVVVCANFEERVI